MGNLLTENTSYPAVVDTATLASDNADTVVAQHTNGPNTAIVAIENELGATPKGTAENLAARLAINIHADGGILRGSSFPLAPPNVPHYFYNTVTNNLYIYNVSTASYDAVTTAAVLAAYIRSDLATTITAVHTFNPTVAGAPFVLGANAQGQKVVGLDAETVDGKNPGSASGLATLDGSTKIVERLAYEGAASGVATLTAGSLVAQEPASKAAANGLASLNSSSKVIQTALNADLATSATNAANATLLLGMTSDANNLTGQVAKVIRSGSFTDTITNSIRSTFIGYGGIAAAFGVNLNGYQGEITINYVPSNGTVYYKVISGSVTGTIYYKFF